MSNYTDKKPIDLTYEEILELITQITQVEYARHPELKLIQDAEDCAMEIITESLERSNRGFKGLKEILSTCGDVKGFKNIMYKECVNTNLSLIRAKSRNSVYSNIYLDGLDTEDYNARDKFEYQNQLIVYGVEIEEDILPLLDTTIDDKYYIVVEDKRMVFNYQNLAKLYLYLFKDKKVKAKEFTNLIYSRSTNKPLSYRKILLLISGFIDYVRNLRLKGVAYG